METNNPYQTNPVQTDNGKTASIISYFWFIGWLIAYFAMYKDNKTDLARYQLRQTLLFHLVTTVISWGLGILFGLVLFSTGGFSIYYLLRAIQVGFFILWIIGLIGAINGEKNQSHLLEKEPKRCFQAYNLIFYTV